jgi:predicted amidohydrolase YtcJ
MVLVVCYTARMRVISSLLLTAFAASLLCVSQPAPAQSSPAHGNAPKAASHSSQPPELILFNAAIYTGDGLAQDNPRVVQAMAIGAGKVIAVGTTEEITRLAGPKTVLRDVNSRGTGTFIFPGFNDAHTHLGGAGTTLLNVNLTGASSLAAMLARIEAASKTASPGHWIIGFGWDHTLWQQKILPTRQDLDRVTGNHPAYFERIDGHIAVVNSAALAAAGINGKTNPPQGGAIDLDANREPTGILRESAKDVVFGIVPPPSHDERRKADELAINDALSHGVTSVQDLSEWDDFLVFEEIEKQGNLHLRISEWLRFADPLDVLKKERSHHDISDPLLHTGMLKGFMDGSLGSRTSAMKAPFADDPANTGLPQFRQDQLNKMAVERASAGFQLGFHAIGDKATAMALEAFSQPGVSKTARNRVEHAQVVDPADIPRFKQLGVIASMQPNHLLTDMNWAEDRLGPQRAAYSYAWKAFLDAGVTLAFGTDYPVEPVTPFRGLYAAVTRTNEAGTKTYFPANKLTRGQSLYAYTQGSAYAEFAEKRKGKLAPGYDADFILVDRDLYTIDAPAILNTKVLQTFVAGKEAWTSTSR